MIEVIYEELKKLGAVKSSDEFSREWLGMEKSYMRVIKAKQRKPSAKAVVRCVVRLMDDSNKLRQIDKSGYKQAAIRLDRLANRCLDEMLNAHRSS